MANPIPQNDTVTQVAFSVVNPLNPADLDQAFATIQGNIALDLQSAIGLVIWTVDQSLGVPFVPDPSLQPKWKHYGWLRLPAAAATDQSATLYAWNDAAVNNPTFLKWVSTKVDLTAINNNITALQTAVTAAQNGSNTANTNASNALTQANAAVTQVVNATNAANAASALATTANTAATSASNLANQANTQSAAAQAAAANALSVASANKTLAQIATGAVGQRIRVNDAGTSNEYYDAQKTIVILQEAYASGASDGATFASGSYQARVLNTIYKDLGTLCTNLAGNKFIIAKGVYRYKISAPVADASGSAFPSRSKLRNTTSNTDIDTGNNSAGSARPGGNQGDMTFVEGIFIANGNDQYQIQTFAHGTTPFGGPKATTGDNEVYTQIILEKIG